ncbi:hypothetical protein GQ457_10G007750 [Hibiscus cannabinus]
MNLTMYIGNLSSKLHWKGLWKVYDRHGRVLDSFIPRKQVIDGSKFGFVKMGSEMEAIQVRDQLHGKWIHCSCI